MLSLVLVFSLQFSTVRACVRACVSSLRAVHNFHRLGCNYYSDHDKKNSSRKDQELVLIKSIPSYNLLYQDKTNCTHRKSQSSLSRRAYATFGFVYDSRVFGVVKTSLYTCAATQLCLAESVIIATIVNIANWN